MKNLYGYIRVSTKDQNEERQLIGLLKFGIQKENIYMDKQSGKDFLRPAYQHLRKRLKKGDLVVIKSIDRLGRNYEEIIEEWKYITKVKKSDIVILDMPLLDTRSSKDLLGTFISDLVLQLLSFVAENERNAIRVRQAEGIAAAKARGVHMGRPVEPIPDKFPEIYEKWKCGLMTASQAKQQLNRSVSAFYRMAKKYEQRLVEHS